MACDFIYNTKNGNSINGSIDYDIFDDSDINLVGTTPESFLFVVSNPADLKLTESGKQLMSSSDIEKFESIDSKTKYMILEVSLKEKFWLQGIQKYGLIAIIRISLITKLI